MALVRKDLAYEIEKVNLHKKSFMRPTPGVSNGNSSDFQVEMMKPKLASY